MSNYYAKIYWTLLQIGLVLIGVGSFLWLLIEPTLEGRNINATLEQIYFHDPFLICVYLISGLWFAALYQFYRLAGYMRHNDFLVQLVLNLLQIVKFCAAGILITAALAQVYFLVAIHDDDKVGGFVLVGVVMLVSVVMILITIGLESVIRVLNFHYFKHMYLMSLEKSN